MSSANMEGIQKTSDNIEDMAMGEKQNNSSGSDRPSVVNMDNVGNTERTNEITSAKSKAKVKSVTKSQNMKEAKEHACTKCGQKFFTDKQVYLHKRRRGCKMQQKQKRKERQDITACYSIVTDENTKDGLNLYQCKTCQNSYPTQFAVKRHIRRMHWNQTNYSCSVCKRRFFDVTAWKFHTKSPLGCRNVTVAIEESLKKDCVSDQDNNKSVSLVEKLLKEMETLKKNQKKNSTSSNAEVTLKDTNIEVCSNGSKSKGVTGKMNDERVKAKSLQDNEISKEPLAKTQTNNNDTQTYCCRLCGEHIVGANLYREHLFSKLGKSDQYYPFSCNVCHKRFTNKKSLTYHTKMHTQTPRCLLCLEYFPSKAVLLIHKRICLRKKRQNSSELSVPKAEKKAKSRVNTSMVHNCVVCEVTFEKYKDKAKHMKDNHPVGSSVVCIKCKKQYPSIKDLRYHKSIYHPKHPNAGPLLCNVCSYRTVNKYALKQHQKKHSEEKVTIGHVCDVCNGEYSTAQALKRHNLTHKLVKNYMCHVCEKSFTQKCTLDRHLNSHEKIKRYKCAKCGQTYTQSYPLTKHVKTFHPELYNQFQQERHTAKWKNVVPEDTNIVKPTKKATKVGLKRDFITIVQVPKEPGAKPGTQKYRYIFMNSAGKVVRANDSDLMGTLMTACDMNETSETLISSASPRMLKAKAKLIKPANRGARNKQVTVIVPPPPPPPPHSTTTTTAISPTTKPHTSEPLNVEPAAPQAPMTATETANQSNQQELLAVQMLSQFDWDASQSECLDMTLGFDVGSNKFALFCDQPDNTHTDLTGLMFDTPMLGQEDFASATAGISDSLNEDHAFSFLQNVPENYWYNFSQADHNLLPGLLLSDTDKSLPNPMENLHTELLPEQPSTSAEASLGTFSLPVENELANTVPVELGNTIPVELANTIPVELANTIPVVDDVPAWAGDQMLLVQDNHQSYLISADDLAKLSFSSQNENTVVSLDENQTLTNTVVTSDENQTLANTVVTLDENQTLANTVLTLDENQTLANTVLTLDENQTLANTVLTLDENQTLAMNVTNAINQS